MSTRETLSTSGTLLAGLWMLAGLFSDGWAHLNVQSTQESFFTPSHLVIYSGFAVAALVVTRPLWGGRPSMASVQRVPGMLAGLIGVLLFGLGGAADLVWHETLGIEVSVEALLSPTHLLLLVGTVLVLTVPLVAAWQSTPREAAGWRSVGPAVAAAGLGVAVLVFFTAYAWGPLDPVPLQEIPPAALDEQAAGHLEAERMLTSGLLTRLLSTVVLVAPLVGLARRWPLPVGTVLVLVTPSALGMAVLFSDTGLPVVAPTVATLVAAAATDVVIWRLRPSPDRPWAAIGVSGALPLLLWTADLLALHLAAGVTWPPELWMGTIAMATVFGLLLGLSAHAPVRSASVHG